MTLAVWASAESLYLGVLLKNKLDVIFSIGENITELVLAVIAFENLVCCIAFCSHWWKMNYRWNGSEMMILNFYFLLSMVIQFIINAIAEDRKIEDS